MLQEDGSVSGCMEDKEEWLGHGYFYYQKPHVYEGVIANTGYGADTNSNFDVLEGGYARLKQARVITADYALLRHDYASCEALTDVEIDAWLLANMAYLSEGQCNRLQPGGDHHTLLGLDEQVIFMTLTL